MTLGRAETERFLRSAGLSPSRALGQNFVVDPRVIEDIVDLAGVGARSRIIEIGPGIGALTVHLASTGASVVAVEKDRRLAGLLHEVLDRAGSSGRVEVVTADALEVDWRELLRGDGHGDGGPDDWTLVANLPYNVAVPILLGMLAEAPMVSSMFAMTQLEVAERLCATPGGRTIGVPTVKVGWYASARIVMRVPPRAFIPEPRVQSAVVSLVRRPPPRSDVDPADVFALVDTAYAKRRKMLRSSLAGMVDPVAFEVAGIDPRARPETLAVGEWAALAAAAGGDRR